MQGDHRGIHQAGTLLIDHAKLLPAGRWRLIT